MSDLSLVLNQLKQNNEEETSRDKNINKNIAFSRDTNKESLLALGKTIIESVTGASEETGKTIKDTQKQSDDNKDKVGKSAKKEDEKENKKSYYILFHNVYMVYLILGCIYMDSI